MKKLVLTLLLLFTISTTVFAWDGDAPFHPVYRTFDPVSGEHYLTQNPTSYDWYINLFGWNAEGVAWYTQEGGTYIYDCYNSSIHDHLYTADMNEVNHLRSIGWTILDGEGFWGDGVVPVYRLYSPGGLKHLYTTDLNEYNTLPAHGWQQEGIAFYVFSQNEAVPNM